MYESTPQSGSRHAPVRKRSRATRKSFESPPCAPWIATGDGGGGTGPERPRTLGTTAGEAWRRLPGRRVRPAPRSGAPFRRSIPARDLSALREDQGEELDQAGPRPPRLEAGYGGGDNWSRRRPSRGARRTRRSRAHRAPADAALRPTGLTMPVEAMYTGCSRRALHRRRGSTTFASDLSAVAGTPLPPRPRQPHWLAGRGPRRRRSVTDVPPTGTAAAM